MYVGKRGLIIVTVFSSLASFPQDVGVIFPGQFTSTVKSRLNDTLEDLYLSDNDSESSDFTEFEVDADRKRSAREDKDDDDIDAGKPRAAKTNIRAFFNDC